MADDQVGAVKAPKKKATRNFPFHELKDAVRVAQTLRDQNAGNPMNSLLVADAMGIAPGSSNYRDVLSSSFRYGLTEGTQKAITSSSRSSDATRPLRMTERASRLSGRQP